MAEQLLDQQARGNIMAYGIREVGILNELTTHGFSRGVPDSTERPAQASMLGWLEFLSQLSETRVLDGNSMRSELDEMNFQIATLERYKEPGDTDITPEAAHLALIKPHARSKALLVAVGELSPQIVLSQERLVDWIADWSPVNGT